MNNEKRIFTSESVTEGHPDKVCDRVSDSVLDAVLAQDPMARVACECAATTGLMLVMGEITTTAAIDVADIAARYRLRCTGSHRILRWVSTRRMTTKANSARATRG